MTSRSNIPSFLTGISQQSKALRQNNLVDDSVNMEYLPSEGATKRYPSEHIAELVDGLGASVDLTGYKLVEMERDDEDYLVALGDGDIKVWAADGTWIDVTGSFGYLTGATYNDIRTQQVADTLFVLNRSTTVTGAAGDVLPTWYEPLSGSAQAKGEAGVFVKQTNYGVKYTIKIKTQGMSAAHTVSYHIPDEPFDGTNRTLGSDGDFEGTATAAQAAGTQAFDMDDIPYVGGYGPFGFNSVDDLEININGSRSPLTNWAADAFTREVYWVGTSGLNSGDFVEIGRRDITVSWQLQSSMVARFLVRALERHFDGSSAERPLVYIEGTDTAYDPDNNDSSSFRLYFKDVDINGDTVGTIIEGTGELETFELTDSESNTHSSGWKTRVDNITDLPVKFKHGAVCRVSGDTASEDDDYYVEFATDSWREDTDGDEILFSSYENFGPGVWRETVARGLASGTITATSMPWRLQRIPGAPNTFDWGVEAWEGRTAGDENTAETPSFVDNQIFDIFWHQNRLGFLANTDIIFSEAGEATNFWRTTVLSLPDSDPIDVSLAGLQGDTLYSAVPFDKRLIVSSANGQAVVRSDGLLSPKSIEAPVLSSFRSFSSVKPILQGRSLFFGFNTGDYTQIREFAPGQDGDAIQDGIVTLGVPKLIPAATKKLASSKGGDDLFVLTEETATLYLLQYLRSSRENLMSAWGRWNFPEGTLVDLVFIQDEAHVVMVRDGKTYLERIVFGSGRGDIPTDFKVRLDRLTAIGSGTFDYATNSTTFAAPYPLLSAWPLALAADTGGDLEFGSPIPITSVDEGADTVSVSGDLSAQPVFLGIQYDASITLSRPLVAGEEGTILGGNTLVRDLVVSVNDTGYLKATVTQVDSPTTEEEFMADRSDVGEISPSTVRSGEWRIPIHADTEEFSVTLSNDTPLPSTLVSGAWALRFNNRYRTV